MCYHIKFGSMSKGVRISRRKSPKLGSTGAQPPCAGGVADPLEICHPYVILLNLVIQGQKLQVILRSVKNLTPSILPFKITQGHRKRHGSSATYDFLLTFPSNHGSLLHCFRDKQQFQLKTANFPHPIYLTLLLRKFPSELVNTRLPKETRMTVLPGRERSLTISLAVWIQYMNLTDRQMDGQTPANSKDNAYE